MAGAACAVTMGDGGAGATRIAAARTADAGIVYVSLDSSETGDVRQADVLVLEDGNGTLVPACLVGMVETAPDGEALLSLAGSYRIAGDGVSLASIVGAVPENTSMPDAAHHWGALGLPDGWMTTVRPVGDETGRDDVASAMHSQGHAVYTSNRRLSVAPGDRIVVRDFEATVIRVDRRHGQIELATRNGAMEVVGFEDVEGLELAE